MIYLNGNLINIKKFPDGTIAPRQDISYDNSECIISWFYDSDEEMSQIYFLKKHLEDVGFTKICLHLPYIPNARMDRIHRSEEIFTLKYFCAFINSLNFHYVSVLDAHSNVALALIDRVIQNNVSVYIECTIRNIEGGGFNGSIYEPLDPKATLTLFYPDAGASSRYSSMIKRMSTYGIKERNWETGAITGYRVDSSIIVEGEDILIIDDICSKGGTFYHAAKALKEAGAKDIYLYVTHCENTIFDGELLKDNGLIKKIYTTDTIYRGNSDKIIVWRVPK